jgi:hypothetical protein
MYICIYTYMYICTYMNKRFGGGGGSLTRDEAFDINIGSSHKNITSDFRGIDEKQCGLFKR